MGKLCLINAASLCTHSALLNRTQNRVSLCAVVACCLSKEQKQSFSVLVFTALLFVRNSRCPLAVPALRQHQTGSPVGVTKKCVQNNYNDMIKYKGGQLESKPCQGQVESEQSLLQHWVAAREHQRASSKKRSTEPALSPGKPALDTCLIAKARKCPKKSKLANEVERKKKEALLLKLALICIHNLV